jgi:hypothetical protein
LQRVEIIAPSVSCAAPIFCSTQSLQHPIDSS